MIKFKNYLEYFLCISHLSMLQGYKGRLDTAPTLGTGDKDAKGEGCGEGGRQAQEGGCNLRAGQAQASGLAEWMG